MEKEHLIYSVPKSGHYVIVHSSKSEDRPEGRIDFAVASPDPGIIPYEEIQHGLNFTISNIWKNKLEKSESSQKRKRPRS